MKIAVVGATGLVGGVMLKVLEERGFAENEIIAAASSKSIGKRIQFADRKLTVVSVDDAIAMKPDFAIFSAGAAVSRQYAPLFAAAGTTVIDNSSAWRKDADKPLVVPEINIDVVKSDDRIIANPNCSTIQMVLALSGLHKHYRIKRLVISTYQSITGTGIKAVHQLQEEEAWHAEQVRNAGHEMPTQLNSMGEHSQAYPYQIFRNLFPHGGDFQEDGYTTEEQKLVDETRKILRDPDIAVTATVARVPVVGGHSEAVNVEFHNEFDIAEARRIIATTPGIVLYDDPERLQYPMPVMSENRDEVFVGRVRRDLSQPRSLNLWVVADNLRKGAATNAIQIMQELINKYYTI